MKKNKILPIRECSCCCEYVDIEMEIFNCPNDKCSYILCKNCLINLGEKTRSDQCPACRTKLPVHYKPIEIITERTLRPHVVIMNRDNIAVRRRLIRRNRCEDDIMDTCNWACKKISDEFAGNEDNCIGDIIYCCQHPRKCLIPSISFLALGFMYISAMCICLLIGNVISIQIYPTIYMGFLHPVLSFLLKKILGFMSLVMLLTCATVCIRCCLIGFNPHDTVFADTQYLNN